MKSSVKSCLTTAIIASLASVALPARAHAPIPVKAPPTLIHHLPLISTLVRPDAAQLRYATHVKLLLNSSIRVGQANSGGGIISSASLHGTGYYNEVIGGSNTFIGAGANAYAIGSGSLNSSTNFINFVVNQKAVPIIIRSVDGVRVSGATSAVLSQNATISNIGYIGGLSGGKLQGGQLFGTIYSNNNVPPTSYYGQANYGLAFGTAGLKNGALGTTVNLANQNGYIVYTDGVRASISRGFLAGSFYGPRLSTFTGPSFSQYALLATDRSPYNLHGPYTFNFPKVPLSHLYLFK
jgi:hypothetical protein